MRHTSTLLCTAIVVLAASGCGHRMPPVNDGSEKQGQAFLTALRGLSLAERPAYVKEHPEGLKAISDSRDPKLINDYQSVLRTQ